MKPFGVLYEQVVNLLRDDAGSLSAYEVEDSIARFVLGQFSQDRPRVARVLLDGDGSAKITLPDSVVDAIADWGHPASFIVQVEYPIDIIEPKYLLEGQYFLYPEFGDEPTDLSFVSSIPSTGTSNVALYHNAIHQAIRMPGPPTVTATGTTGSTTYEYRVSARDEDGNESTASLLYATDPQSQKITNGNATLTGSNYNAISWNSVIGATEYRVYRVTGGATTGRIATQTTTSLNDTGLAASGSVSAYNYTNCSVTTKDRPAAAHGAVASCYLAIAGKHSGNTVSAFSADAVGWGELSDRAVRLASEHWKRYLAMIKPSPEELKPAFTSVSFDPRPSWGGEYPWAPILGGPKGRQRGV